MKIKILLIASLACAAVTFSGCTTTGGSAATSDTTKLFAKAAVEVAVVEVAGKDPAKAARILEISQAIKKVAGTDGFNTVDLLVAAIRLRANIASLTPAQQVLANALIDVLATRLRSTIGDGPIAGGNLLIVAEVAGWVEGAAQLVVAPAPAA